MNYQVPLIRQSVQDQINQKFTEASHLRKQSRHLLKAAKNSVEVAIERNEDTATKWLNEQVKYLEASS